MKISDVNPQLADDLTRTEPTEQERRELQIRILNEGGCGEPDCQDCDTQREILGI